jgi:hypothetical protein
MRRPELTIKQILAWADAHYERTGRWPEAKKGGRIWETVDEKWANIDMALRTGLRGLHRGQSLARLLDKHRGKRNRKQLPRFTLKQARFLNRLTIPGPSWTRRSSVERGD